MGFQSGGIGRGVEVWRFWGRLCGVSMAAEGGKGVFGVARGVVTAGGSW
jgi:hypothetical protein